MLVRTSYISVFICINIKYDYNIEISHQFGSGHFDSLTAAWLLYNASTFTQILCACALYTFYSNNYIHADLSVNLKIGEIKQRNDLAVFILKKNFFYSHCFGRVKVFKWIFDNYGVLIWILQKWFL